MSDLCLKCERGQEACQYCVGVEREDWEVICDCGLHDFDMHLTDCESRSKMKYVIAIDVVSSQFPREG